MAKSLDAEMAAIEAEERKLMERRKAHQQKVREAAIGTVEKAGLFKLADSDDAAHLFRSDRAHHSELMPPGRECLIDGLVCH